MSMRLALLLSVSTLVFADGNSDSATVNAGITAIRPIAIVKTADLNFGTFVVDGGGGFVTVNPNGVVNTAFSGNIWTYTGTGKPMAHPATFEVTGENTYPFRFHAPLDIELLHQNGGRATFRVIVAVHESLQATIPTTVNVGGLLTLADPRPGVYTGSFNATVNYM